MASPLGAVVTPNALFGNVAQMTEMMGMANMQENQGYHDALDTLGVHDTLTSGIQSQQGQNGQQSGKSDGSSSGGSSGDSFSGSPLSGMGQ